MSSTVLESQSVDFTRKSWRDDVAFILEEKKLYTNKAYLSIISPVFDKMFTCPFIENGKSEINLPGKKYEEFHEFLKCVYVNVAKEITEKNVYFLFPIAHEYQVKDLLAKCISKFKDIVMSCKVDDHPDDEGKARDKLLTILSLAIVYDLNSLIQESTNKLLAYLQYDNAWLEQYLNGRTEFSSAVKHVKKEFLSDVLKRYSASRTHFVKHSMLVAHRNIDPAPLANFENAVGNYDEVTLEVDEDSYDKCYFEQKTLVVNNVYFKICVGIDDDIFSLDIAIENAPFDWEDERPWMISAKSRIVLKKYPIGKLHEVYDELFQITKNTDIYDYCQCVSKPLKEVEPAANGYVKMGKVTAAFYILVNSPVIVDVNAH